MLRDQNECNALFSYQQIGKSFSLCTVRLKKKNALFLPFKPDLIPTDYSQLISVNYLSSWIDYLSAVAEIVNCH